jgi:hypothetical protein
MRAARWIALFAVTAAGCFTADFKSGTVRCSSDPNNLCPSGYACLQGYCYNLRLIDGGNIDDGVVSSTD